MACETVCERLFGSDKFTCIDLSYPLGKDTIYWPSDELGFQLCMNCSGSNQDDSFYAAGSFSCAEHVRYVGSK